MTNLIEWNRSSDAYELKKADRFAHRIKHDNDVDEEDNEDDDDDDEN